MKVNAREKIVLLELELEIKEIYMLHNLSSEILKFCDSLREKLIVINSLI